MFFNILHNFLIEVLLSGKYNIMLYYFEGRKMKEMKKKILVFGIVSIFMLASLSAASAIEIKKGKNTSETNIDNICLYYGEYTEHEDIVIDGNNAFSSENGVTGGSGTESDPYIIDGWELSLIEIKHSDVYFVIQNCLVTGGSYFTIHFENVDNGVIDSCILDLIKGSAIGIALWENSNNNIVSNSKVTGDGKGIYLGISLGHGTNNVVHDCEILDLGDGFCLGDLFSFMCTKNIIYNCNVHDCIGGVYVNHAKDNLFYHNNFYDNDKNAHTCVVGCDSNIWYYGFEGNYWDDYSGVDLNDDGIGDVFYYIDSKNIDERPLMKAYGSPSTPVVKGPSRGKPGVEYEYIFYSEDANDDQVCYRVDWGDKTEILDWMGPYDSGEEVTVKHTFETEERFVIKVQSKDVNGFESKWGSLAVEIPKTKMVFLLLERLFQRPIFNNLLVWR